MCFSGGMMASDFKSGRMYMILYDQKLQTWRMVAQTVTNGNSGAGSYKSSNQPTSIDIHRLDE